MGTKLNLTKKLRYQINIIPNKKDSNLL